MALDFQIEPFFDDYSEDKKFHRILFRPGYAVQARELTQLQTILQRQISRHGDHMFKEGSMIIPGQITYDLNVPFVKLSFDAGVDAATTLASLVDKEITNENGLIAKVINYAVAEGSDLNTIFVKYKNSVQVDELNVTEFAPYEVLTPVDGSSGLDVIVADTFMPTGLGCSASIERGIYYIKKNFVLVTSQTIILDKYTNTPSYRVGLSLSEQFVYPEEDESLLDNALGSPNYSAPGAARYFVDLTLSKLSLTTAADQDFIDLLRLRDGKVIYQIDRTTYAEIEKTLARRTYDESGDYTVTPFKLQNREYRNNLRGDWSASEKFIQGDLIKVPDGSGAGFYYFVAVTTGISSSTRPTFSTSEPSITDNQITWEYMAYPSFNQGINTFVAGDTSSTYADVDNPETVYTSADFTVSDHIRLDGMLALGVEAGKAYVRGYEIEKLATEYIAVEKSRYLPAGSNALCAYFGVPAGSLPEVTDSLSVQKTANIDVSMGAYIIVNNVRYLPNLVDLPYVNLHSTTRSGASTNTIIGKTRIRGIEKHTDTSYKVFLFDTILNAGKSFSEIRSIYTDVASFQCDSILTGGATVLQDADKASAIFSLPDYAVNSISEVTYSVVISFTETANTGSFQIAAPAGYTFESANDSDNYLLVDNSTGFIITDATITVQSSGNALLVSNVDDHSITILATMKRADSTTAVARRSVDDMSMEVIASAAATAGTINLNHSYVTRIVSVLMDSRGFTINGQPNNNPVYDTNITNRYIFNSGQEITHIGLSSISLTPGAIAPTGPVSITYEYLSSIETAGDIIAVDSYTHNASMMRYDQIIGVSGYVLRDSIDFRPYATGGGYAEKHFPKYGTTASIKYNHHLYRTDNISLSSTGAYIVNRGIPSLNPVEPSVPQESMKLASIDIEPYTFLRDTQSGISINRVENKRYTMRDIGKLERRISDLEYYTALTLTELDTKNMRIIDSNGVDRFQNGFLVDSFTGQGVGNPSSDDWNASIDTEKKELRPFVSQRQVDLLENVNALTKNYKVSGDLVTLPFTETILIEQAKASRAENVNPYNIGTYRGIVNINPVIDTWFSTHYRPDIILTDEKQYEAIVAKAKQDGILGTIYNSVITTADKSKATTTKELTSLGKWSTADTTLMNTGNNGGSFWRNRNTFTIEELDFIGNTNHNIGSAQANSVAGTRVVTYDVVAVPLTKTFTGTTTTVIEKFDSRIAEERIVDTQVIPYIRPRAILFTGFGFMASTNMNSYFDNIQVNDYITPATRLKVSSIVKSGTTYYPTKFDVERNAGSAVSDKERKVLYNDGVSITGTVAIENGSNVLNGTGTSFSSEVLAGDIINFGGGIKYEVDHLEVISIPGQANQNSNTRLFLKTNYTQPTVSDVSVKVIGPKHTSEEIEIAFNHGEVIREVNGNGNTAIVVGQEIFQNELYLYVLNIKGTGKFSTATNAYLEGEYLTGGDKARVKFVERTDFTTLTTSLTGQLNGIFRIPSSPVLKFKTGKRELRFSESNNPNSALRLAQEKTGGGTYYEATGTLEVRQRTIISTRTADLQSVPATQTQSAGISTTRVQTGDTGWFDPLAQTFLVQQEGGAFITSVDLFFNSKDAKIPVRIEIREVVNGYPGRVVLPFSRVEKKSSEVLTSVNSTVATTFKFTSPVFLQDGVEYALVVLSESNEYTVWISQTLELDVTLPTKPIISSQPYPGVLFKSQNASTWTADQTQDLKFTIRRASFSSSPVSIELIPPTIDYKSLDYNPLQFTAGSRKCRVTHPNHGMLPGEYVMLKSRQVINSINAIPASVIFETPLQILTTDLDSYVVEFGGTTSSNTTGASGGGYLAASENFEFETAMLDVGELVPPGTKITYDLKTIDHSDSIDVESVTLKSAKDFDTTRVYPSTVNYSNSNFPSGLSVIATLIPSTNASISPVIDLGRASLTMISNKIDNPSISVNDSTLDVKTIGTLLEIGTGKVLELIDLDGDTIPETLVVDGTNTEAVTLFREMNNNLNVGSMLKLTYTGITNAVNYFVIVDKRQDADGKLYFTLEAHDTTSELIETGVDETVDIVWLTRFKSEYAPIGGSAHSKYVTKKINFSRPSEMLKIMFAAQIPAEAEVDIYYKTGVNIDGDFISSRYYKALPDGQVAKSNSEFTDITATIEDLAPFDSVMVKLVMRSINKAKVPHIKDFRVIACAA
jgi:hypothetical protein